MGAEERRGSVGMASFPRRSALRAGGEGPGSGAVVLVRDRHHELRVYFGGQRLATLTKRPQSQDIVYHPEQFRTVAPASAIKAATKPLGHQVTPPEVARRPLSEYDRLFGLEVEGADERVTARLAPLPRRNRAARSLQEGRLHGLTYEAFFRRVLLLEDRGPQLGCPTQAVARRHAYRRAKPWKRSISRFSPRSMSGCCGNWQTSPSSKRKPILCFWAHRHGKNTSRDRPCVKAFGGWLQCSVHDARAPGDRLSDRSPCCCPQAAHAPLGHATGARH